MKQQLLMTWLSQKLSRQTPSAVQGQICYHASFLYLPFASQLMSLVFIYLYPLSYYHSDPDTGGTRGFWEPKSVNKFFTNCFFVDPDPVRSGQFWQGRIRFWNNPSTTRSDIFDIKNLYIYVLKWTNSSLNKYIFPKKILC
jgi:hypothetical protein